MIRIHRQPCSSLKPLVDLGYELLGRDRKQLLVKIGYCVLNPSDRLNMSITLSKAKLSDFRKLRQKRTRRKEGKFLIDGWHMLQEALKAECRLHAVIWDVGCDLSKDKESMLGEAISQASSAYEASSSQILQLLDTTTPQGVCAIVDRVSITWELFTERLKGRDELRIVLLDEVSDPGNCGTIIRACDWFGMDGVVLGENCAEPESEKVSRSTMGSLFHIPIVSGAPLETAIRYLKSLGARVLTSELDGDCDVYHFDWPVKAALVIGNEARGVSSSVSEVSDTRLSIPRFGKAESLNAAMAATVFMSSWRNQTL